MATKKQATEHGNVFRRIIAIDTQVVDDQVVAPGEIEMLQTGEWDTPWHGKFVINHDTLVGMVQHFNDGTRKGVPIDLEHNSYSNDGAAGWIEGLEIRPTENPAFAGQESLWGEVKWTPAGEEKIANRQFRFFSPEFADEDYQDPETGEYLDNVLIGGGLTNRPLFKNLTAVRASDNNSGSEKKSLTASEVGNTIYLTRGNDNMNLKDLLAKKPEDLTDDEKAFVVEHKDELDDDQVTSLTEAGVLESEAKDEPDEPDEPDNPDEPDEPDEPANPAEPDNPSEPKEANEKKGKMVKLSANELKKLQDDAAAGRQASEQLALKASEEHIESLCFSDARGRDSGKLPIAAKKEATEFYHGLNGKQRKAFDAIVEKLPSLKLFSQLGDGGKPATGKAIEEVEKKANEIVEAAEKAKKPKITFGTAVKQVLASDKALAARYNEEKEE